MEASPKIPWLPVLAAAGVAIALFARTLGGGLLSDDLLLGVLGEVRDDGGFTVDWGSVLADFGRPWLGYDAPFYRPLLTVSFAVDQAAGDGAPWPFHLTNVLLHAMVAAASAALAALLCRQRPALAAWIAGLAVAVHPVAVEPVAWIAARNSELEVTFRTMAMVLFALHLRTGARRAKAAALALGICAFATKESAVMLPISLLAIDFLDQPRRPWRERFRLHRPFWGLVVAYFVLRLMLFGALVGDGGGTPVGSGPERLVGKLLALLATTPAFGLESLPYAAPLFAVVVGAGLFCARRELVIGALWLALHALPTWQLAISSGLGGSRMIYGALPVLGLVFARVLLAPGMPRAPGLLATMGWSLAVFPTMARLNDYDQAWRDMEDAKAGILALADRASPERPLALAAMPPNPPGIPPCNPNAWFTLAERPHQPRDVPVVSLGFVTVAVPLAGSLHQDPSAIHAVEELGCAVATWDQDQRSFRVRQREAAVTLPELRPVDGQPGAFAFARPVAAMQVEALTVRVEDGPPRAARVTFRTAVPDLPPELASLDVGGGATIEVDLTHHMGPPSLATFDFPILGFQVTLDGPGRVASLDAHARVPELAVGSQLEGRRVGWDAFSELTAPNVADGATLRLVLLGPHSAIPVPCTPGKRVTIPDAVRRQFDGFARIARHDGLLFWFEATAPPGTAGFARSRVGRVVLADP